MSGNRSLAVAARKRAKTEPRPLGSGCPEIRWRTYEAASLASMHCAEISQPFGWLAAPCPKLVPGNRNFDFVRLGSLDSPKDREAQAGTVRQLGWPGYPQQDIETDREILNAGETDLSCIDRERPATAFHGADRRALIPNRKFDGIPGMFQRNLARENCSFDTGWRRGRASLRPSTARATWRGIWGDRLDS
jgi:hypothetical protein